MSQIQNKIICDTNVWYYIEDGTIKLEDYTFKYPLYSTYLNLHELFTSDTWNKNPEKMFRVIDIMLSNSEQNLMIPNQHIKNICIGEALFVQSVDIKNRLDFYQQAKCDFKDLNSQNLVFESWLREVNRGLQEQRKLAQEAKILSKKLNTYFDKKEKKKYREEVYEKNSEARCKHLGNTIKSKYEDIFGVDTEYIVTYKNEARLFIECSFKFIESMSSLIQGHTHQENDFEDLDILMYVNRGDLYWTEENRWLNLIKDAGMVEYLEPPKSNKKFSMI